MGKFTIASTYFYYTITTECFKLYRAKTLNSRTQILNQIFCVL